MANICYGSTTIETVSKDGDMEITQRVYCSLDTRTETAFAVLKGLSGDAILETHARAVIIETLGARPTIVTQIQDATKAS